jgi:hypothetical protein
MTGCRVQEERERKFDGWTRGTRPTCTIIGLLEGIISDPIKWLSLYGKRSKRGLSAGKGRLISSDLIELLLLYKRECKDGIFHRAVRK